jgi:hypothetical protein
LPVDEVRFVEGLALEIPHRSARAIFEELLKTAPSQHWPLPSYYTVWRIVSAINPALLTLAHEGRAAHAPFGVDSLANRAVEMCGAPAIPGSLVSYYTSSNPSKGQLTGETRADCTLARPP